MIGFPRVLFAAGMILVAANTPRLAAQTRSSSPAAAPAKKLDPKSAAYYHAALAHLYSELAEQYGGRGEYVTKAIESYKAALAEDPSAGFLAESLADLYVQSNQLRTAVTEFEEMVRKNPSDVNSRRILARFYTARIREGQQNRLNEDMIKAAIEQYEKIAELAPKDFDNQLMLARLYKLQQRSTDAERVYKRILAAQPDNEDAMTGLAIVYADLGNNQEASSLLSKVAEKNPNLRTLTALASTYEQMKDYKQAAATYGRALELNKENPDLKRAYAQSLFVAEDYPKAQSVFEELLTADSNDLLALLRLSQIYRQQRNFDKAAEYARRARQLDPTNLEVRFNEVSLLEAQGKTSEAIATLKELLDGMPKTPDSIAEKSNRIVLLERLGVLYRMTEQFPQAVAAFREIGTLDPDSAPRSTAQIIDALRAAKDFTAASKETEAALQKYPGDKLLKSVASSLYSDLGQFSKAETLLKGTLNGKDDRETYAALAQVYEKQKNFTEMAKALDAAEKLAKSDDDKENIYFMRGAMYERMKKYEEAEAEFKKVLAIDSDNAAALNYLGYMLADRSVRLNEALDMIKKAVDQEPANGAYLDSLGWVYYRLNRLDEAVDALKRSLEHTSKDPTVHEHLGDVYLSRNSLKDAITQWEQALNEWRNSAPSDKDDEAVTKVEKKIEGARVRLARESGDPKRPQ